jgi:hypothetical protein
MEVQGGSMHTTINMTTLYRDIVETLHRHGLDPYDMSMMLNIRRSHYNAIEFLGETITTNDEYGFTVCTHSTSLPKASIHVGVSQTVDPQTRTRRDSDW